MAYGVFSNIPTLERIVIEGDTYFTSGVFDQLPNLEEVVINGDAIIEAGFNGTSPEKISIQGNPTIDSYTEDYLQQASILSGRYIRIYASPDSSWFNAPDLPGVYIVNPAEVSLRYIDSKGNNLAPMYYALSDSLTDYTVAANPTADFSLYYRAGDSISLTPPTIAGYVTPEAKTFVLGAGINNLTYTYKPVGLPNTGNLDLVTYLVSILGLSALAYGLRRVV